MGIGVERGLELYCAYEQRVCADYSTESEVIVWQLPFKIA
jgi:hypothetical protein